MKKRIFICAVIPFMMMTGCNNNDKNDTLTDTQNVNYDPVSYRNQDRVGMNDLQENRNPIHRFIAPVDPNGDLREFTHLDPGEEFSNEGTPQPNQPAGEPNAGQPEPPAQEPKQDSQSSNASGYVKQVIDLTNQERKKNGLSALKMDGELSNVAEMKSEDMKEHDYFSHTSPTYGSPFEMMENFGVDYSTAAENIAVGQKTPESVVNAWMDSPGHRKNILNKQVTHIGVGTAKDASQGIYWTQMFIAK
ncbi:MULTISPECIES: CAP domain-containing protein [Bacillaceae]|uniref:CAP domain-containing protein n=1 Tax=Bacillaceae TaxID=186817 RepID=UPI00214ACFEF|nr:CAP domain-containing protein [Rossellomorea sp. YZS02]MDX8346242.1 CAP domain-containing protein [Rossellomorea sp. YZS02]